MPCFQAFFAFHESADNPRRFSPPYCVSRLIQFLRGYYRLHIYLKRSKINTFQKGRCTQGIIAIFSHHPRQLEGCYFFFNALIKQTHISLVLQINLTLLTAQFTVSFSYKSHRSLDYYNTVHTLEIQIFYTNELRTVKEQ